MADFNITDPAQLVNNLDAIATAINGAINRRAVLWDTLNNQQRKRWALKDPVLLKLIQLKRKLTVVFDGID